MTTRQRQNHVRALRMVQETLKDNPSLQSLSIPMAMLKCLHIHFRAHTWAPTTRFNHALHLEAALKRLELYCGLPTSSNINLKDSPIWEDGLRQINTASTAHIPDQATPLTKEVFTKLATQLNRTKQYHLLALLVVAWSHAARPTNVLSLRKEDISFSKEAMTVTWRRAKTCQYRGPYTTFSSMLRPDLSPSPWMKRLKAFVQNSGPDLFPVAWHTKLLKELLALLKTENLVTRSIRRGSLTTLADAGKPIEVLMVMSGHTNKQMLYRYLGWGSRVRHEESSVSEAARQLW